MVKFIKIIYIKHAEELNKRNSQHVIAGIYLSEDRYSLFISTRFFKIIEIDKLTILEIEPMHLLNVSKNTDFRLTSLRLKVEELINRRI